LDNHVRKLQRTRMWNFIPFPSVVMEIPAYTQKLNQEFLSQTKVTLSQNTPVTKVCDRDVGIIDMHIGNML
jgi:hypothetical protein